MPDPHYYFLVFGDPAAPERDSVESGRYHLGIRGTHIPGERGDILLLYCTGNYPEHYMSVPGVGILLTKDNEYIHYRYLPLSKAIPRDRVLETFTEEDKTSVGNIRFDAFWMFQISPESFRRCLADTSIQWP